MEGVATAIWELFRTYVELAFSRRSLWAKILVLAAPIAVMAAVVWLLAL